MENLFIILKKLITASKIILMMILPFLWSNGFTSINWRRGIFWNYRKWEKLL